MIRGQHEFTSIRDVYKPGAPSSLDRVLTGMRSKGIKVLDFWRHPQGWTLKTMVPR